MNCYFGHHRSGSSYVRAILERLFVLQGLTTATVHREEDLAPLTSTDLLILTNASLSSSQKINYSRGFHIIRDPRDVEISSYFSHRYCHKTNIWKELVTHRLFLESLDFNEGLTHEITVCRKQQFEDMAGWNYDNPGILEIKFENLIKDPQITWANILDHIGIKTGGNPLLSNILLLHNKIINSISMRSKLDFNKWMCITKKGLSEKQVQTTLEKFSFENLSGRPKGFEDVQNHYRKGTSGDCKNYFTDTHKRLFQEQYGELLIHLDYERNTDWT
ncbi:MAG: hypothetical protein ACI9A7_001979 [Cyclobacteriaceae bacterium]